MPHRVLARAQAIATGLFAASLLMTAACGTDGQVVEGPGGADAASGSDDATGGVGVDGGGKVDSVTAGPDGAACQCSSNADCAGKDLGATACTEPICDTSACQCVLVLKADSTACDDGDACTSADACKAGQCQGAKKDCDDGDKCTEDLCDAKTGQCTTGEDLCACKTDKDCAGSEDGDLCNGTLRCDTAQKPAACVVDPKTVVTCDPANGTACKTPTCTPKTGACDLVAVADGQGCDDGSVCTKIDKCAAGVCTGGQLVDCDDDNVCTTDQCDPAKGCTHKFTQLPCDDGSKCTLGDQCLNGKCKGLGKLSCDDNNPCTDDQCFAEKGCVALPNKATCDDGNGCTKDDQCAGGQCSGKGGACDCQTDEDCKKFDDGDRCNGTLFCDKSVAGKFACKVKPNSPIDCSTAPSTTCLPVECEAKTGKCIGVPAADKTPCDDSDACTLGDVCQGGGCSSAQKVNCNDANPCTSDSCDAKAGCKNAANTLPCDDGNACTQGDLCADSKCGGGKALDCDDGNACTKHACLPASGCSQTPVDSKCDDGNACTTGDACEKGQCKASSVLDCDDKNDCTLDKCDPVKGGCQNLKTTAPCEDGNACTVGDKCADGACQKGAPRNCNDGQLCTDDSCDPANFTTPCKNAPNADKCSDGDACTTADQCFAGKCKPGPALKCDDNEVCTADSCDADKGCVSLPTTVTCTDENPCTTGDACNKLGKCAGTGKTNCDDGNSCTFDSCDPSDTSGKGVAKGCVHVNNNAACDDGNACTKEDQCEAGTCKLSKPVPFCCNNDLQCNDGRACTTDKCVGHVCVNDTAGNVLVDEGFEQSVSWKVSSDNPKVTWQRVASKKASGGFSLYCGNAAAKSYDFGETIATIEMPEMTLPLGSLTLSFNVWMDTEDNDCEFDTLEVTVNGTSHHTICPSTNGWKSVQLDMSAFQGRTVKLGFWFETGDEQSNKAEGVYIDNVKLAVTSCAGAACKTDKECDDLNSCSGDRCEAGKCAYSPTPTHGVYTENFDDMAASDGAAQGWALTSTSSKSKFSVSTKRSRSGKQSLYGGNPATGKYDDGAATWNAKLPQVRIPHDEESVLVLHVWMDVADSDCSKDRLRIYGPSNVVLAEVCKSTGGKWQQVSIDMSKYGSQYVQPRLEFVADGANNGGEGAYIDDVALIVARECEEDPLTFEENFPFNFQIDSDNALTRWHVTQHKKHTGIRSLHAANPSTHTYNHGAVSTTATTGMPVALGCKLTFRAYAQLKDAGCDKDVLTVTIGDKQVHQQCKSNAAFDLVTIDLAPWASQSVPVTFTFSADAANNSALGPYIDDIILDCP